MCLKFECKRSYHYFSFHQFCSYKTGQTGVTNRSALPADPTGQTGPMAGQTGLRKTERMNTLPSSDPPDKALA